MKESAMDGNTSSTSEMLGAKAKALLVPSASDSAAHSDENLNLNADRKSPQHDCHCLPGPANALGDSIRRAWTEWRRHEADRHAASREQLLRQAQQDAEYGRILDAKMTRASSRQALGEMGVALFFPLDGAFESSDDIFHDAMCDEVREVENDEPKGGNNKSDTGLYIGSDEDEETEEKNDATVQVAEESETVLVHCPYILSPSMMQQIHDHGLPSTVKMKRWVRLYSLLRDGDSFGTFLSRVSGHNDTLFVIRTSRNEIVGGFADAAWAKLTNAQDGSTFYGTGKAFLFSVDGVGSSPMNTCKPSKLSFCNHTRHESLLSGLEESKQLTSAEVRDDTEDGTPTPSSSKPSSNVPGGDRVILHAWQGLNHYNQLCHTKEGKIAMGGGGEDASFGVCIEDHFRHGTSGPCDTFGMIKPLTSRAHFEVVDFEIYGFCYAW